MSRFKQFSCNMVLPVCDIRVLLQHDVAIAGRSLSCVTTARREFQLTLY